MVQHNDGSIAIQVFIGASAVNSVGVTQTAGPITVGTSIGTMSFGTREAGDWIKAKTGERAAPPQPQKPSLVTRFLNSVTR